MRILEKEAATIQMHQQKQQHQLREKKRRERQQKEVEARIANGERVPVWMRPLEKKADREKKEENYVEPRERWALRSSKPRKTNWKHGVTLVDEQVRVDS